MMDFEMNDPNVLHSEEDYVMHPNARSIWITVDGISVNITRNDEGVVVDVYPLHDEATDPVLGTYVFYDEVQYTDVALAQMWEEFDVEIDDEEKIEAPFLHFPKGTDRMGIWHWFDERFSEGLGKFLEGRNAENN